MIKKIDIAGIQLDNYSSKEMMVRAEQLLEENTFGTIGEISMKNLLLAKQDKRVLEAVESLDYTMVVETAALDVAGVGTIQRKREIEGNEFFFHFMKYLERNGKRIFLLGETEERLQQVYDILIEEYPKINVAGLEVVENCNIDWAAIINEINTASSDVLISLLPSPMQEYFLLDYKDKISTGLWYGMEMGKFTGKRKGLWAMLQRWLRKNKLKKIVNTNGVK